MDTAPAPAPGPAAEDHGDPVVVSFTADATVTRAEAPADATVTRAEAPADATSRKD